VPVTAIARNLIRRAALRPAHGVPIASRVQTSASAIKKLLTPNAAQWAAFKQSSARATRNKLPLRGKHPSLKVGKA
jgi:hypothetical protein